MSAHKSRKEEKIYKKYQKTVPKGHCVFCPIEKGQDQWIRETKNFKIIRNIFAYSIFDGQEVDDHLMIVPKKHINSISKIPDSQKIEYVDLLQDYEKRGYNVYARAPQSVIKSVVHQHTHLIKTKGKAKNFIFLIRKPYIRLVR